MPLAPNHLAIITNFSYSRLDFHKNINPPNAKEKTRKNPYFSTYLSFKNTH
jgi:hypothetical protein